MNQSNDLNKPCTFREDSAPWIILMLGAVGLRFLGLCHYDIWYDEALSALAATIGYGTYYQHDFIAYGYYSLVHYWMGLFGASLFALRSLSAIASALCVYPMYRLTESLFDRKVAIAATVLFVLSPFQIWYAQELRNYSLIACEALFFAYMLWRYRQTGWIRYGWGALLLWVLGFLTDYRMVPYLLSIAIFFRKDLGRAFWVSFSVLLGALMIGFSGVLRAQWAHFLDVSFWPFRPKIEDILITLNNFVFGYIRQPATNVIMLGVTGLLLAVAIFTSPRDRRLWAVKAFCFIPIVVAWIFSQFSVSIYIDRFFIVYAPAWYVLIAHSIVCMRRRLLKVAIVAMLCFCLMFSLLLYYSGWNENALPLESFWYRMHKGTIFKHPVAPVFKFLSDHYKPGDMIFFSSSEIKAPLSYYLYKNEKEIRRNDVWRYAYVSVKDFLKDRSLFSARKTKALARQGWCLVLDAGPWPEARRYWLVSSHWHRGARYSRYDNQSLVSEYMRRTAERVRSYDVEGVTIELFVKSEKR